MTTRRGIITGFRGNWASGLGFLFVDGVPVVCENAQTVRCLDGAFGDVIAAGHTVNQEAIVGQEIIYTTDHLGMLEAFTPIDEWPGPEIAPGEELHEE